MAKVVVLPSGGLKVAGKTLFPVGISLPPPPGGKTPSGRDGLTSPVTGWTGLWLFPGAVLVIPAIVWFVKIQGGLNRYWSGASTASAPAQPEAPPSPA